MSPFGPSRTSRDVQLESEMRSITDVIQASIQPAAVQETAALADGKPKQSGARSHFNGNKVPHSSFKEGGALQGYPIMATVLIVEDDDQVRLLAQSYLEEHGHRVLSAGTPDGALATLNKTADVDMLFTDLALKGEIASGIKLAKEAKQLRPDLKVLYTTGRAITDGMKARFVEGSAFLEKPYTTEQLATALLVHFRINHHR